MITDMKNKVVCFGEMLWDILPGGAMPGGAPMNVAYHLQKLGLSAALISRVGTDSLGDDLKKLQYDEGKTERFKQWIKNLRSDIYLDESVKVVNDMIVQNNLVYNPTKQ